MKPILLGLVFLCVGLVAPRAWGADYRIGMIAPLSGPKSDRGVPMRNAVELFVEQLNKRGGIFGTRIQLVVEDDLDDPARAREGAQRLAADPSVLAIIGHYYPGPASGAVSVYDKEQIPCISPNVGAPEVLRASPWMFTTTVADEEQGSFLAVYLKAVLKRDNVLVVHTADPFGESLRAAFARKAVAIGLTVVQTLSVENRALPPDWVVRSIPDIADRAGIGAVAALTHSEPGLSLVPQLRDVGITAPIVAPSTWTNPKFLTQDEAVLGELYVASPLLWELANEKATRFAEAYRKTYGESPTVAAAMAYDSALLIAEGLTRLAAPESKTPPSRDALRRFLAGLTWQDAVDGATGTLFFSASGDKTRHYVDRFHKAKAALSAQPLPKAPDFLPFGPPAPASGSAASTPPPVPSGSSPAPTAPPGAPRPRAPALPPSAGTSTPGTSTAVENRAARRDNYMSIVKDGRYKAAFTQLVIPKEEYVLRDLSERTKKGYVTLVDEIPYHLVDVVFVGIDVIKIHDVNTRDMNWDADMFVWFKWSGDRLDVKDVERIGVVNAIREQSSVLKEELSRPIKYRAYRKRYTMSNTFDLAKFPFDSQELKMTVAHANKNSTHVMLVMDARHMDESPVSQINPPEWTYRERKLYSNLYQYSSTFGDPDYRLGKGYKSRIYFSTVNLEIGIKRILAPYLFTFFMPLLLILGIILLIVWVPVDQFSPRIGSCISGLVGILVYHMSQKNSFPKVGYAMIADYYFIVAYVFVIAMMIGIIVVQKVYSSGKKDGAHLLNKRIALGAFGSVFVIYAALTLGLRSGS